MQFRNRLVTDEVEPSSSVDLDFSDLYLETSINRQLSRINEQLESAVSRSKYWAKWRGYNNCGHRIWKFWWPALGLVLFACSIVVLFLRSWSAQLQFAGDRNYGGLCCGTNSMSRTPSFAAKRLYFLHSSNIHNNGQDFHENLSNLGVFAAVFLFR